jgi:triosephosphate isomerase (TIM)
MSRRPFIAGNWKMYKGPAEADALAAALKRELADLGTVEVAVAPPFVSIPAVAARLKSTGIGVAGQDLHPEAAGAYTGSVSGEMLKAAGCTHVIIGHSERRHGLGETDAVIARKVQAAFRAGLLPILCIGETLAERDNGQAEAVVIRQLEGALAGLSPEQMLTVTLAYEPVWAIGTGRNATPDTAQAMHAVIRGWLGLRFPPHVARALRIQYGGSVKGSNAAGLLGQADIDGALVGGASLDVADFVSIVKAAG